MGAVGPTRFSRVSVGFRDSVRSLVDVDPGDTGAVFSVTGTSALGAITGTTGVFTSTLSVGGAITADAAITALSTLTVAGVGTFGGIRSTSNVTATSDMTVGGLFTAQGASRFNSTLTVGGDLTATTGLFVGSAVAINELVAVSSVTTGVSFGALGVSAGVSLVTVAMSGATRGDTIVATPDSLWQQVAANRYVQFWASSGSTSGEVNLWAVNSGLSAVTPAAGSVFRLTRINHPSYL